MIKRYRLLDPRGEDLLIPKEGESRDVNEFEITRVQSLLSQWLRMENIVSLLGAGCSVSQGGLTIGALEEAVIQLLMDYYEYKKSTALQALVKTRNENKKSLSFEEWLSYVSSVAFLESIADGPIEHFVWRNKVELAKGQLSELLNDLGRAILGYCSLQLPEHISGVTGHHAFLGKMVARDPSLGRLKIFTLNYDTLLEQALDHLAIQYADGFVGQVERRFDPSCYGLDVYYPGDVAEGRVRRYDKFVQLYKLHGSIHWWENNSGQIKAVHPSLDPIIAWRKQVQSSSSQETKQDVLSEFSRLLNDRKGSMAILPTANKYVQTIDLPYSHLFRAFHQVLQQTQTFFIVIGYGFGDEHVNCLIEDALINPSLVMLVVDPTPQKTVMEKIKKYQGAGARVYLLTGPEKFEGSQENQPATFDDFAKNVLPNVAWMDEWVRLKRMETTLTRDRLASLGQYEQPDMDTANE